jgi:WD40 repeat protein
MPLLILGTRRFRLRGHISALAVSPDGSQLAASSTLREVTVVFELPSGRRVFERREGADHVAFTRDGKSLLAACARVQAWTIENGKEWDPDAFEGLSRPLVSSRRKLYTSTLPIRALAVNDDATWVAVATGESAVTFVDVRMPDTCVVSRRTNTHTALAFIPGRDSLVTGGTGPIFVWHGPDTAGSRSLPSNDRVEALTVSPNGKHLMVRAWPSGLRMIELASGREIWKKKIPVGPAALAYVDGETVAVADRSKVLFLDARTGRPRKEEEKDVGPFDAITQVAVSPDGTRAVTTSRDGSVVLWDLGTGARVIQLASHGASAGAAEFSPAGTLVASCGSDGTLRVRPVEHVHAIGSRDHKMGDVDLVSVAWSPDGSSIAVAMEDGSVHVVDTSTWRSERLLPGFGGREHFGVAFANLWTLVAARKDAVVVYDIQAKRVLETATVTQRALAMARDGSVIAVGIDEQVHVLRLPGLERVWKTAATEIAAMAFGPRGELAVTTFGEDVCCYWPNSGTQACVVVHEGGRGDATALAFIDSERLLVGTSHGETLVVAVPAHASSAIPAAVRRNDTRLAALAAQLDAFRRKAVSSGYRGPQASVDATSHCDVSVPVHDHDQRVRTARVRGEIRNGALVITIIVGAGSEAPRDPTPRDPIARARRWIRERLGTSPPALTTQDASFAASLPAVHGLAGARVIRDDDVIALSLTLEDVPELAWLEAVVSAVVGTAGQP